MRNDVLGDVAPGGSAQRTLPLAAAVAAHERSGPQRTLPLAEAVTAGKRSGPQRTLPLAEEVTAGKRSGAAAAGDQSNRAVTC